MLLSFLATIVAVASSFGITFLFFKHYYIDFSFALYFLSLATAFLTWLFTIPQKTYLKPFMTFAACFMLFCIVYNFLVALPLFIAVIIVCLLLPRRYTKERILFADNSVPVFIRYNRKISPRRHLSRMCIISGLVAMVLFLATFSLPSPYGVWGIKAFPVDLAEKVLYSDEAVPSGMVTCATGYDNAAILINSFTEIETAEGIMPSPAQSAGMLIGDVITTIDSQRAKLSDFLTKGPDGKTVEVAFARSDNKGNVTHHTVTLEPHYSIKDKKYMIGITYYDAYMIGMYSSVQTVSFMYPENGIFAATAHSSDMETKTDHYTHIIKSANVTGRDDTGLVATAGDVLGEIFLMNRYGSFGIWVPEGGNPLPIAKKNDIRLGKATMLSSFEDNIVKEYEVTVTGTYRIDNRDEICLLATDERIKDFGGITRGMSGSPIIQNGKIIGALSNTDSEGYCAYATFAYDMAHEIYMNADKLTLNKED